MGDAEPHKAAAVTEQIGELSMLREGVRDEVVQRAAPASKIKRQNVHFSKVFPHSINRIGSVSYAALRM